MFIFFLCTEHTGIEKRRKKGGVNSFSRSRMGKRGK
jgi:hypothetical protein